MEITYSYLAFSYEWWGQAHGVVLMFKAAEVWDVDLRPIKVNKDNVRRDAQKYRMGSVRLALGRITTEEEFKDYKMTVLRKQLP